MRINIYALYGNKFKAVSKHFVNNVVKVTQAIALWMWYGVDAPHFTITQVHKESGHKTRMNLIKTITFNILIVRCIFPLFKLDKSCKLLEVMQRYRYASLLYV